MNKLQYLFDSTLHYFSDKSCPYCGYNELKVVDKKFLVTTLYECQNCKLYFRHPKDTVEQNRKFYQKAYTQKDNITTDLPSEEALSLLLKNNFGGTAKDYTDRINFIKKLVNRPNPSIIDFGANWGYTSYQLKSQGFEVQAYEISESRAAFGQKLGIDIQTKLENLDGDVDVFFNAHVIEHLPNIKQMFLLAQRLLKEDGLIVIYCPNGADEFRFKHPDNFHKLWGQVHSNYLNDRFFKFVFRDVPYLIGSSSISSNRVAQEWDLTSQMCLDLTGDELFAIAKIKKQGF
ncbi:MAG: methyltransferase domain-containing protein [Spirosomataceae bacterium]